MEEILKKLNEMHMDILSSKTILTMEEGCKYLGQSKSHVYKLTSSASIPHFKCGKLIYFERTQLENWIRRNPVHCIQDLAALAQLESKRNRQ